MRLYIHICIYIFNICTFWCILIWYELREKWTRRNHYVFLNFSRFCNEYIFVVIWRSLVVFISFHLWLRKLHVNLHCMLLKRVEWTERERNQRKLGCDQPCINIFWSFRHWLNKTKLFFIKFRRKFVRGDQGKLVPLILYRYNSY